MPTRMVMQRYVLSARARVAPSWELTAAVPIPGTGASLSIAYPRPISQDVHGVQQVMDWRMIAWAEWSF